MVESPTRDLEKMPIKFLLTRHSHSCVNALKDIYKSSSFLDKLVRVRNPIRRFLYTDPELTKGGLIKAKERGEEIYNMFIKPDTEGPLPEIYSSILYRAQQTADLIRQGINDSIGKESKKGIGQISLLPYISEIGLGYDNKQDTSRIISIKPCTFFIKLNHVKSPHIANPRAFLSFITDFIKCRGYETNMHTHDEQYIDAIIISHGNFMKKIYKMVHEHESPNIIENLDSLLLTLAKSENGMYFIKQAEFRESSVKIDKSPTELCNTGCDLKRFGKPFICNNTKKKGGKRAYRHTRRKSMKRRLRLTPSA